MSKIIYHGNDIDKEVEGRGMSLRDALLTWVIMYGESEAALSTLEYFGAGVLDLLYWPYKGGADEATLLELVSTIGVTTSRTLRLSQNGRNLLLRIKQESNHGNN